MKTLSPLALCIVLSLSSVAEAQIDIGKHGGEVVVSQGHPIELVRKGEELLFYFSDHDGAPASTAGMKGKAIVQDGGKTSIVSLTASAPNLLVGKGDIALSPQSKVVLTATLQGKDHEHSLTARFAQPSVGGGGSKATAK